MVKSTKKTDHKIASKKAVKKVADVAKFKSHIIAVAHKKGLAAKVKKLNCKKC